MGKLSSDHVENFSASMSKTMDSYEEVATPWTLDAAPPWAPKRGLKVMQGFEHLGAYAVPRKGGKDP